MQLEWLRESWEIFRSSRIFFVRHLGPQINFLSMLYWLLSQRQLTLQDCQEYAHDFSLTSPAKALSLLDRARQLTHLNRNQVESDREPTRQARQILLRHFGQGREYPKAYLVLNPALKSRLEECQIHASQDHYAITSHHLPEEMLQAVVQLREAGLLSYKTMAMCWISEKPIFIAKYIARLNAIGVDQEEVLDEVALRYFLEAGHLVGAFETLAKAEILTPQNIADILYHEVPACVAGLLSHLHNVEIEDDDSRQLVIHHSSQCSSWFSLLVKSHVMTPEKIHSVFEHRQVLFNDNILQLLNRLHTEHLRPVFFDRLFELCGHDNPHERVANYIELEAQQHLRRRYYAPPRFFANDDENLGLARAMGLNACEAG